MCGARAHVFGRFGVRDRRDINVGVVAIVFVDVWALFCQREAVESSNISNDYLHFDSLLSKDGIQCYSFVNDIKMFTKICLGEVPSIQCINKQNTTMQPCINIYQ